MRFTKLSKISKINTPLLIIALVSVFAFVVTKAFFTDVNSSPENVLTSGTVSVAVNQDSVLSVSDWRPGEQQVLEFAVENTGSMPVEIKGYLHGAWSEPNLDPEIVEIIAIERKEGENWIQVTQNGGVIGQEFYLSADGTENSLLALEPQEVAAFRLTVQLSETAPDEYQNQTFVTSLHIAGRQITGSSSWPATY
ncbi:MAG: hypothetical protein BroJett025_05880 [Patescibacteria group bacterium]|nr:MAG: hypothetical protein BroJett025_05880 [Patescibacteria group bacterium]